MPTHQWKHSWSNSLFRNEGPHKASELIRQAVRVTRFLWGDPPADGFVTYVDPKKVRQKQNPGHCYVIAGWRREPGITSKGLIAFRLTPERFEAPLQPDDPQFDLNWGDT